MTGTKTDKEKKAEAKKARLAEQLRTNLQKRKAQTRSRRTGEADSRPEGISTDSKEEERNGS